MPSAVRLLAVVAVSVVAVVLAASADMRPDLIERTAADHEPPGTLMYWPMGQRANYWGYEQLLASVPTPGSLRSWHELLASEPHIAGSPGDLRQADRIADAFRNMGLEVEKHEIWPLLARPVSVVVEVLVGTAATVEPEHGSQSRSVAPADVERIALTTKEQILPEDAFSANSELTFGWNAYSGSGEVTAEVVYANYGAKEDFQKLAEMGVDVRGKIVLARYGKNFRGLKARFAEQAGAAALLIFTDPSDSGYMKGLLYPEGGYANDTCIERGSVSTLDYPGDPLTPGIEATKDAARLRAEDVPLCHIPVQPLGWGAAQQVVGRMKGTSPALPAGWQGGLPFPYRVQSGSGMKVHLKVEQARELTRTYNIIGILRGEKWPEQKVIVGSHHDAWGFGACDPTCGTIVTMEAARAFAELARRGQRPARTIVFAAWGAEEFSIIGSTEWVEKNLADLRANGVSYINLDMSSMGPDFGSSASPSLRKLIAETLADVPPAARAVVDGATTPDAGGAGGAPGASGAALSTAPKSVLDEWRAKGAEKSDPAMPKFGAVGGGSDHVGFYCVAGIASASLGGGGAPGTAYHSVYDTLTWYRQIVGEDYESALMVSRAVTRTVSRLANAPLVPLDPVRAGGDARARLEELAEKIRALEPEDSKGRAVAMLGQAAREYEERARVVRDRLLEVAQSGKLTGGALDQANATLIALDRAWLSDDGLPGREWFKNLYGATDEDSGYGAWVLPALSRAVERRDAEALAPAAALYEEVFARLARRLGELESIVGKAERGEAGEGAGAP